MEDTLAKAARRISSVFAPSPGAGFSLPKLEKPAEIKVSLETPNIDAAKAIGVTFGNPVDDLTICYDASAPPCGKALVFCRGVNLSGRVLLMGKRANYHGPIHIDSQDALCVISDATGGPFHGNAAIRGNGSVLLVGSGATSNGTRLMIQGDHTGIAIGDDCMFANDIEIAASDCHAIIDLKTHAIINPPRSTVIGPHVWIGARAIVLKGRTIEYGSIVSAGTLVTSNVPPMSLTGGSPNRILRSDVTWSRHNVPNRQTIQAEVNRLADFGAYK